MLYYHEFIFMPDFDFEHDFWNYVECLFFSGHASMRAHMRVFPLLSVEKVRKDGEIYEVGVDEYGIKTVNVRIPVGEGRNLYYVIDRSGMIITGWYNLEYKYKYPARNKRKYEDR